MLIFFFCIFIAGQAQIAGPSEVHVRQGKRLFYFFLKFHLQFYMNNSNSKTCLFIWII